MNAQTWIMVVNSYLDYVCKWYKYFYPHSSDWIKSLVKRLNNNEYKFSGICIMWLCEIDAWSKRTKCLNQCEYIVENSFFKNYEFFSTYKVWERVNQWNAIFHKWINVINTENFRLTWAWEPRYLSKLTFLLENKEYDIYLTHLSLTPIIRMKQLEELASIIDQSNNPKLLMWDFNTELKKELLLLERTKLTNLVTGKTFPSWKPKKKLDYIYYSSEFWLIESDLTLNPRFSDHLMLNCKFNIL